MLIFLIISVTPLNARIVNANSRTEEAGTRAASIRPILVKMRITGIAKTAETKTSLDGKVPKGIIAKRNNEVMLNTARSVILISLIGQACL